MSVVATPASPAPLARFGLHLAATVIMAAVLATIMLHWTEWSSIADTAVAPSPSTMF